MKFRLNGLWLILFLVSPVFAQDVSIKTDRPDAIYDIDTKAVFIASVPGEGALEYILSYDGKGVLKKDTIQCKGKRVNIEGSLKRPGFLRCSVVFTPSEGGKSENAMAAAAFEPDKIQPADGHMPADFDNFWRRKKCELAVIPMEPVMTPEASEEGLEIYDVNIPCLGVPVRGYYAKPAKAPKASCPAIAFFQGAGVSSAHKGRIMDYGKEGLIALEINAHGIPNGQSTDYYKDLYATTLRGYRYGGRENPDTGYFTGMFLRVYRALEFLKAQPEWDGKHLIVYGSSQGGAQAIAAAGLDEDVTFLVASVPAMCSHGGEINGWPKLVPVEKDGSYNQQILAASKYVDCVNFACKTKAPAFFTVGFIDKTCRATSIYVMYNSYAGCKEVVNNPLMGHSFPGQLQKMAREEVFVYLDISIRKP